MHTRWTFRRGFTLLELLISMGLLGVMGAGWILAMNPGENFVNTRDAERRRYVRELQNAIYQYVIDSNAGGLPGDKAYPSTSETRMDICRDGAGDTSSCMVLDTYLVPDYIVDIPVDPAETDENNTGFALYQQDATFVVISAEYLGQSVGGAEGEGDEEEVVCEESGGEGLGTSENPYTIATCQQLQDMANDLAASYELVCNIDCNGFSFSPIGEYYDEFFVDHPFTGSLDGNNFTISDLTITVVSGFAGMFGYARDDIDGIELQNITFEDPVITGPGRAGTLGGYIDSETQPTTITNVHVVGGTVTGKPAGGLMGTMRSTTVSRTSATADVIVPSGNSDAGGLIGYSIGGTVQDSYTTGDVTTSGYVQTAGIVGDAFQTLVQRVYASGDISAPDYAAGGIVGSNGPREESILRDSFSVSSVTAYPDSAGGIVGQNYEISESATTRDSRWYTSEGNPAVCAGLPAGIIINCSGEADLSYFYDKDNFPMSGWDFDTVWQENPGALPTLR